MPTLILKPGREQPLRRRHPWIFSGAVARTEGEPASGATVVVRSAAGEALGVAAFSPGSRIAARIWSWNPEEEIGPEFLRRRLETALALRRELVAEAETDSYRLVHAESDGLPGVVLDRYGSSLVLQCLSAGAEAWREVIAATAQELTGAERVHERSDVEVRTLEGLPPRSGTILGPPLPGPVEIREGDLRFAVDLAAGHKTGFYLDQRGNRRQVAGLLQGREVLDCFSYSGGFALHARKGGAASVLAVESSPEALFLARESARRCGLEEQAVQWQEGDVFKVLRTLRDSRRSFDAVILDPPRFAARAGHLEGAVRGYNDINVLAFKLLRVGGYLVTFSCSGAVTPPLFEQVVANAARDAGVEGRIVARLSQGPDHPVALPYPEGAYLKGLVVRVTDRESPAR